MNSRLVEYVLVAGLIAVVVGIVLYVNLPQWVAETLHQVGTSI